MKSPHGQAAKPTTKTGPRPKSFKQHERKVAPPRKRFENDFKYHVIKQIEEEHVSRQAILCQYDISAKNISNWITNKDKIIKAVEESVGGSSKKSIHNPMHRMEKALVEWFDLNSRLKYKDRIAVNGYVLSEKALTINESLLKAHEKAPFLDKTELKAYTEFRASPSWASKFAKAHGWKNVTFHGESGAFRAYTK